MRTPNRKVSTLLERQDLEALDSMELWAESKFKNAVKVREIYAGDIRPVAECEALIGLIKSVRNVKDFYTLPQ